MFDARTVLITGAASGIGKAAVASFLRGGALVTALDVSDEGLALLRRDVAAPSKLITVKCDVSSDEQQQHAFQQHMDKWGRLDIAILNAGITESGKIFEDSCPKAWQRTLDVDLRAVLMGVHLATRHMGRSGGAGVIISVSSAAGVYGMPDAPVYTAAKGGLVHFTRSAAHQLSKQNIRICTVCPQFVDTNFLANLNKKATKFIAGFGKLLTPEVVVAAIEALILDSSKNGVATVIMQTGKMHELAPITPAAKPRKAAPVNAHLLNTTPPPLPSSFRKWQVQRLSTSFSEACSLVHVPMPAGVGAGEILVQRCYSGVNASDVNFTSGKYHGSAAVAAKHLPFDAGFESVGIVVRAGEKSGFSVGQAVATLTYGGFSEYAVQLAAHSIPLSSPSPEAVAMLTSGLTASVSLKEVGRMGRGETVLVTAAAGGTGMFAVQLAKLAGNYVIGTCSSASKGALLKRLGVDRVVNYKQESLKTVLKEEFPNGVDLVYESVGGEMFQVAVDALANKGRLIVIGMMSQYSEGWPVSAHPGLPEKLLKKSALISGFFLPMYAKHYRQHLATLFKLMETGKLQVVMDPTTFQGIESVPRAVEYLQSGSSSGKVVVQISDSGAPSRGYSRL